MNRIYDMLDKISPLDASTHLSDVLAYFRQNKHIVVVPVTRESIPIGVLRERDLKEYVYSPFGKEVLLNTSLRKSINDFLVRCSISDINTSLDLIIKLFSTEENQDGIIITKDGEYVGFLNAFSILKMLNEKQTEERFASTIDSLVVGVAHEINTPLGIGITATSYVQEKLNELQTLINDKKLKKSDMEHYLKSLMEASETLYTNLNRVANLTNLLKKISVNRHYEDKKRFNVLEAARLCKEMVISRLGKIKHEVVLICDEKLEISTYYELFNEVVINLFENALEHAFTDEKKGHIELSFKQEDGYLVFTCKDDGKGIDDTQYDKIFEPFYTTRRNKGKIGLGLNIVQNILAHRLNGSIKFTSEKSLGTTFTIAIPL